MAFNATSAELLLLCRRRFPQALDFLRQAISSFLPLGFSAVILQDRHGRELVHAGELVQQPQALSDCRIADAGVGNHAGTEDRE